MDNYGKSVDLYNQALNAAGTTQQKYNIYLEGTQAHLDRLKNAMQGLWSGTFNSNAINSIVDGLTHLVSAFGSVVGAIGPLPTLAALVTAGFMIFNKNGLTPLYTMLTTLPVKLSLLKLEFRAMAESEGIAAAATRIFSASMIGLTRAFLPIAIITGVVWGLTELFGWMAKNNEQAKKTSELIDQNNQKYKEQSDQLSSVADYYKKNYDSISSNVEVKDQLFQMQNKLIDTFGAEAKGIDLVNGKYDEQIKKIDELNQKNLDSKIKDNQILIDDINSKKYSTPSFQSAGSKAAIGVGNMNYGIGGDIGIGNLGVIDYYKKLDELYKGIQDKNEKIFSSQALVPKNTAEWANALAVVKAKIDEIKPKVDQINSLEDDKKKKIELSTTALSNFSSEQKSMFDQINNAVKGQPTKNYEDSIKNIATIIKSSDGKGLKEVIDEIKQIPQIQGNTTVVKSLDDITSSLSTSSSQATDLNNIMDALPKAFDDAVKPLKELNQALHDVSNGQSLTSEAVANLISQYPQLASAIHKTADGWTIEKGALEAVRQSKIQLQVDTLKSESGMTTTVLQELKTRLLAYGIELDTIKTLDDARKATANIPTDGMFNKFAQDDQTGLKGVRDQANQTRDDLLKYGSTVEAIAKLEALMNDRSYGVGKDAKPKAAKDVATFRDLTKERIAAINAEAVAQDDLNKKIDEKAKKAQSEKDYQKAIQLTTDLIKGEQLEISKLGTANKGLQTEISTLQKNHSQYNMKNWLDSNGEASLSFGKLINGLKSKKAQDEVQGLFDKYQSLNKAIKDNSSSIDDNSNKSKENQKTIDSTRLENSKVWLDKLTKAYSDLDAQLDTSKTKQSMYAEGSKGYNDEAETQTKLLVEKDRAIQNDISTIEKIISANASLTGSEKRTSDQIKALTEDLKQRKKTLQEVQKAEYDYAVSLAQNLVNIQDKIDQTVIESYQNQIDTLQKQWDAQAITEERSKRILEISQLQSQLTIFQSGSIASISDELAKQLGLEKEKADAVQHQNDLIKQQQLLQSIENEKNVQLFKDGQFQWVADPRKVRDETDKLEHMQKDWNTSTTDNLNKVQSDLKQKQEDYSKWELDQSRKATIDQLQQKIKQKEDEIKLRDEKFKEDVTAWATHGVDLNTILSSTMETLKGTYGTKWDEMLTILAGKLTTAKQMYADMMNMSGSAGGVFAPVDIGSTSGTTVTTPTGSGVFGPVTAPSTPSTPSHPTTSGKSNQQLYLEGLSKTGSKGDKIWADQQLKLKKYETGGLNTETGPAWLDGTPSNPELVLKADDTKNLLTMIKSLPDILSKTNLLSAFQVKTPDFSSILKPKVGVGGNDGTHIHIANMTVKTNNAREFINNLTLLANNQY